MNDILPITSIKKIHFIIYTLSKMLSRIIDLKMIRSNEGRL